MANQDAKYEKNVTKHKWLVVYTRCVNGRVVKQTWKGLQLSQKSTIREILTIYACSDHGQPRYQILLKCDKRQMTSCVHNMCGWTYGQTNMKRATTLARINHLWNRYNMRMLRLWPTEIPNMNKMWQKKNDQLRTQDVWTDVWSNKHDKGYDSHKNQPSVKLV